MYAREVSSKAISAVFKEFVTDVAFSSRRDANAAIREMQITIARKHFVTVEDFANIAGVKVDHYTDVASQYGWNDLSSAKVVTIHDRVFGNSYAIIIDAPQNIRLFSKMFHYDPGQLIVVKGGEDYLTWRSFDRYGPKTYPTYIQFVKEYPRFIVVDAFFVSEYGTNHYTESIDKRLILSQEVKVYAEGGQA